MASYLWTCYWFVGGRTNLLKYIVYSCVPCAKLRANSAEQLMAQLPPAKVTVSRPFAHCGVDFAGPFSMKCTGPRTTKFGKAYTAIFVRMTVRAVHIEIVSDLSTLKFIEVLQRFNNFVGTKNFSSSTIIN